MQKRSGEANKKTHQEKKQAQQMTPWCQSVLQQKFTLSMLQMTMAREVVRTSLYLGGRLLQ
jgi:hypothetical protein